MIVVISDKLYFFLLVATLVCGAAGAQTKKDSVWIQTQDGCKIHNPNPQKKETISWTGSCVNGYADGEGTLVWYKNGDVNQTYTGAMKRGSPHGYGKYDHGDGSIYEGHYVRGKWEGTGKFVHRDKQGVDYSYEGDFKNGDLEGVGTEIYYDKGDTSSIYRGSFFKGERHGHGVDKASNVRGFAVVEGNFQNGLLQDDSAVIHEYTDGGVLIVYYKGGYENGARTGYGEEVMGLNKYEGQWQHGRKQGAGKLIHDGVVVYDGEWKDGKFDGTGMRFFLDGSKYKGQFVNNERHGFGVLRWKDGACYIGEFRRDLFAGKGYTLYRNNHINTAGIWEKGGLLTKEDIVPLKKHLETRYRDLFERMQN